MVRQHKIENSLHRRVNEYLSHFKAQDATFASAEAASESALDDYLLERAAEELRAAQTRLDDLKREIGRE